MNILEISEKFKISVPKLRKMDKAGVLILDEDIGGTILDIRHNIKTNNNLTVMQLVYLVDNPAMILQLGRYISAAQTQIDDLGDIEPAPRIVGANLVFAARAEPDSVAVLVEWIKAILPSEPVGHTWLGVRLLLGCNVNSRREYALRLGRAFFECRKQPDFASWWHVEKKSNRNVTIYQKPATVFDL